MAKTIITVVTTPVYDVNGNRVCTCGSGQPWQTCVANSPYCG